MICKNCGAELKEGAKFCGKCGSRVEMAPEVKEEKKRPEPAPDPEIAEAVPEYTAEEEMIGTPMEESVWDPSQEPMLEEAVFNMDTPQMAFEEEKTVTILGAAPVKTDAPEVNRAPQEQPGQKPEAQQGIICPNCGAALPAGARFCASCGKSLMTPSPAPKPEKPAKKPKAPKPQKAAKAEPAMPKRTQEPEMPQIQAGPQTERQGTVPIPQFEEKKKHSPVLWIVISLVAVLVVAAIVVIAILFMQGKIGTGQTAQAQSSARVDEESSEEESSQWEESEEQEVSEVSAVPEVTMASLECGAQIPLEATSADLSGYSVANLRGIEGCTQLKVLKIDGGSLTDLTPLLSLPQLETLMINHVPVSDITLLSNMDSLKYLDIKDTQVTAVNTKAFQTARPDVALVGYTTSSYELIARNCNWDQAKQYCEEAGGHLVTIENEQEMQKILPILKDTELVYIWLGGYSENNQWYWVTGETWGGYLNWYPGEPSGKDSDGTLENKLCLWNVEESGWTMNDQRNDLTSFTFTQGKLGYICETEQISGIAG